MTRANPAQPTPPGTGASGRAAGSNPEEPARVLSAAVARFEAVLSSALDPILTIDAYGIIQSASKSVQQVFGYAPQEIIGQNVRILMPEPHRSEHDGYLASYRRTGATNILGRTREFEAVHRSGRRIPIELSVSRVDVPGERAPLFMGIIHDTSERKQSEEELRLLQNLTLTISSASSLQSAMTFALRQICLMTGWAYADVWLPAPDGEHLADGPAWHDSSPTLAEFRRAGLNVRVSPGQGLVGRVWRSQRAEWLEEIARLSAEDGFIRRDAAVAAGLHGALAVPIIANGSVVAVLCFLTRQSRPEDRRLVTLVSAAVAPLGPVILQKHAEEQLAAHRRQLEETVRQRTAQLQATHEQLRVADRLAAIGTLAAGLGHDMHNVLLPIRCRLDALDAAELPRGAHEQFHEVRRSIEYLQHLADGLHLLALNPDDNHAASETTDLGEWWAQARVLLARALPKSAELTVDLPAGLPRLAIGPHALTQAILNLVVNAGEAIDRKAGRVRLWAAPCADGRALRVGVTDNGSGMPAEVRDHAFDPFFTTKPRGLGTGLGLALVRGVAQAAGGTATIESEPGQGTTIVLELPVAESAATPGAGDPSGAGLTASVAVTDERAASLLEALLSAAGLQVARRDPAGDEPETDVWVVEPRDVERIAQARRFLRDRPGRRILLFGAGGREWRRLGAIAIERTDDFEEIRKRVTDAVAAVGRGGR